MRYRLCVVLGMLSLASPVGAQDLKQQWAWCLNKDNGFTNDQWMAGCTAVIDANRETPENRAIALRGRGNAYVDKGQPERAIEDYDQALRLAPHGSGIFVNRGIAYAALGQFDRAIQDYDEALRLKPDFAEAYYFRGEAWRDKADPTARSKTTIRRCG
jgi:tetratricopeptide (TPR) repeat protein